VKERWTARRLLTELAAYLLLAGVLTAIFASVFGLRTFDVLAAVFVFNLLVALSIGGLIDLGQRLTETTFALDRRRAPVRLVVTALVVTAAVFLGVEIALALGAVLVPSVAAAFPREGVLRVAIPVSIAMVLVARERNRARARALQAELRAQHLQGQALQAQLAALQSRTNPHFLFNALNTIAALVGEDAVKAERAVERLADLLRYALEGSQRTWVPLADELAAVESYLELERLRFGDRLRTRIDVDAGVRSVEIPPMSLQPLVENAVLHGVAGRRGPTQVELVARPVPEGLEVVIDDDGPGPAGSTHAGTGTAHRDLRERLHLLYGERARVDTGASPSGGYRVRLVLPPCTEDE